MKKDVFPSTLELSLRRAILADADFSHFDLGLDVRVLKNFQNLNIQSTASYSNFGEPDHICAEIKKFLGGQGNDIVSAQVAAEAIDTIVKGVLGAFQSESAWVSLRSFSPTTEYDVPRWHTDGYYYEPFLGDQKKVVATLKGAPTLINDLRGHLRQQFNALFSVIPHDDIEGRKEIAALVDSSKTSQAFPGQGSIFVAGSARAALHSEPPIKEPRLFLSVLPGSSVQIEELRKRWNKPSIARAVKKAP